jgi:hypothetical protein
VEFSINAKQGVAIIWTIIAIVIALIVVLAMGSPSFGSVEGVFVAPWQWLIVLFFGLVLIITVPVYLLIVLWHIASRWDAT